MTHHIFRSAVFALTYSHTLHHHQDKFHRQDRVYHQDPGAPTCRRKTLRPLLPPGLIKEGQVREVTRINDRMLVEK